MPIALIPILVTLIAGACLAVQPATNAALARSTGSVLFAALVSFALGTVVLLAAWWMTQRADTAVSRDTPLWAWAGGLYGVFYVSASIYAAPRLGLAVMLTIAIASQLAIALVLDHFGLLNLPRVPITVGRVLGVVLVLGGVVLVRRG